MAEEPVDGSRLTVDPRYRRLRRTVLRLRVAVGAGLALLLLLMVVIAADDLPGWIRIAAGAAWLLAVVAAGFAAGRWPEREYAHLRYALGADTLRIWRGVYWQQAVEVPRSRVQHTDVSQGPFERRYGLGTVVVYTAGTDHARVALPGLAHDAALALRDQLRHDHRDDIV